MHFLNKAPSTHIGHSKTPCGRRERPGITNSGKHIRLARSEDKYTRHYYPVAKPAPGMRRITGHERRLINFR